MRAYREWGMDRSVLATGMLQLIDCRYRPSSTVPVFATVLTPDSSGGTELSPVNARVSKLIPLLLASALIALAGCGGDQPEATDDSQAFRDVGIDDRAAAMVPPEVKQAGTIQVATTVGYPPNEFYFDDTKQIIGMDPDLARAIGQRLGLETKMVDVTFEEILPDVQAGEYFMAMSSFTITPARRKVVDMVSYFLAGTGFFTNASSPTSIDGIGDLCGRSVAIVSSTIQVEDARRQGRKCVRGGRQPVKVNVFLEQDDVTKSVQSGDSDVGMADSPVAAFLVKQSGGAMVKVGEDYGLAPYGVVVNRPSNFAEAVRAAVQSLIDDGTYMEILDRWGLAGGAIKRSSIYD